MTSFHIPPAWRIDGRTATPQDVFLDRRRVVQSLGLGTLALAFARPGAAQTEAASPERLTEPAVGKLYADKFPATRNTAYAFGEGREMTPEKISASYNNFYEFTTAKERVWQLAQGFSVDPWKVEIGGLVKKPQVLDLDDIFGRFPLEERLYRFRCVERWSMQVPWTGYPLRSLIDYCDPLPSAKWVQFTSINEPKRLPGQRESKWYPWPYYEGLRLDEARNELAFVVVGSYGHALPMQHGAPWRLAIPWKYGYKNPKSIVRIEFTKKRPQTFWNETTPDEYGFFSNIEPQKPHPRWSQQWETDIATEETRETVLYNGYSDQVGSMYDGSEF